MKTHRKKKLFLNALLLSLILIGISCKKENSAQTGSSFTQRTIAALQAVAVGIDDSSNDSVYVIGTCANDHHLDSISFSGLPATITAYLSSNYAGYTFQKAFTDEDTTGNTTGYVVIVLFNGNPVGLKFDASGNFVKVLEQREGHDLSGRGWHNGGRFDGRDGRHRDTIALTSLPETVLAYFTANYPGDTLVKAYKNRDSSYLVFSKNNGAFVTLFNAGGLFVKRTELANQDRGGNIAVVDESALPVEATSYLSSTYPQYIFQQAFAVFKNGALLGYVVCIDANGTKYAVAFDASGNFIRALTVR